MPRKIGLAPLRSGRKQCASETRTLCGKEVGSGRHSNNGVTIASARSVDEKWSAPNPRATVEIEARDAGLAAQGDEAFRETRRDQQP